MNKNAFESPFIHVFPWTRDPDYQAFFPKYNQSIKNPPIKYIYISFWNYTEHNLLQLSITSLQRYLSAPLYASNVLMSVDKTVQNATLMLLSTGVNALISKMLQKKNLGATYV